jgi:MoaD family protein
MKITVEYTAHLKRATGKSREELELPADSTLEQAIESLLQRHGDEFRNYLMDSEGRVNPSLVVAVNDEQVFLENPLQLSDGDTVVLLAAIAGGL